VAAFFVALPLVVAACGAAETAPRKRAQEPRAVTSPVSFAQQATGICTRMQRAAGVVSTGHKPTEAEFASMLTRWRIGFDRLARLRPPDTQAKPYQLMLRHYRRMVTAMTAAQASDDESVLADVAAAVVEGTRGSRAARRADLRACAFFPDIRQPPRDRESTLAATEALVPAGARVLRADTADCNREGSCLIEFRGSGSTASRLRSALATLRAHGWRHLRTGHTPTGTTWASAYRNDLQVEIELVGAERPAHCADAGPVTFGCSDSIWVHRVEVPSVLTGG
jgi:hypothetical protein